MGKLKFLWPLLKANIGLATLIITFYVGAQNHHLIDRIEHNLFRRHLTYTSQSHRGSLEVEDVENDNGQLEKRLVNLETGNALYTLCTDGFPPTGVIYQGLRARAQSVSHNELQIMHEKTQNLGSLLNDKLNQAQALQNPEKTPEKDTSKSRTPLYLGLALFAATGAGALSYARYRAKNANT